MRGGGRARAPPDGVSGDLLTAYYVNRSTANARRRPSSALEERGEQLERGRGPPPVRIRAPLRERGERAGERALEQEDVDERRELLAPLREEARVARGVEVAAEE